METRTAPAIFALGIPYAPGRIWEQGPTSTPTQIPTVSAYHPKTSITVDWSKVDEFDAVVDIVGIGTDLLNYFIPGAFLVGDAAEAVGVLRNGYQAIVQKDISNL